MSDIFQKSLKKGHTGIHSQYQKISAGQQ